MGGLASPLAITTLYFFSGPIRYMTRVVALRRRDSVTVPSVLKAYMGGIDRIEGFKS